ncbi:MAG TPA: ABC transporter permease [Humibacter sp.]|nr:ABC transporter permease [Humibacter sp.]
MTTAVLTASDTPGAHAGWFAQTAQITKRWITNTLRVVWGAAFSLVQPVVWILLFGQVFSSLGTLPQFGGAGYIDYLVPGVLMMTVLYSGAWAGSGYIDDMKSGVMDQLLTAPISRSAIITGQLVQQLLICLAQSIVVLGIGWLGGARYPGGIGGTGIALVSALVLGTTFCSVSTALALTTRNQVALIGISQIVVLPVTFLSTTMMPSALMPGWVQNVSRFNPMTWAVDIGRHALAGTTDWGAAGWQAAGLVALAALAFFWSVRAIGGYQRSL